MAENRFRVLLNHLNADNSILSPNSCANKNEKDNSVTVQSNAIEAPVLLDIESKLPTEAFLLPLFTRPIFPHVKVSAIPKYLLNSGGAHAVDRIKRVIERLTSENGSSGTKPISALPQRKTISLGEDTKLQLKKGAFYNGPIIITDRAFTDTLAKLKNNGEKFVVLCLAKSSTSPITKIEDVHQIGVLTSIEIVDPNAKPITEITLTALCRVSVSSTATRALLVDNLPVFKVGIKELRDTPFDKELPKNKAIIVSIVSQVRELCKLNHPLFKDQLDLLSYKIENCEASEVADLCASLTTSSGVKLQQLLNELNVAERLKKVHTLLTSEIEVCKLVVELSKTNESSTPTARRGLGSIMNDRSEKANKLVSEFKDRLKSLQVPEHAMKVIEEEMNKLGSLDPTYNATEHYTCRNYVNWLTNLPWGVFSTDNLDLKFAHKVLEEDHYGMQDVKERILEFIAVASLKGALQGKILCFVGPPGTGKTSIAKSIARSLQRKFTRFSVGGMHDVSEIKGHRRTYIGAMPGKLIQSLKLVRTSNPVILIDEIDKLSKTWDGDPSSALLEVLDPEQNSNFLDHYIDVPFDLSKVLFICTANSTDTIPRPLLDRMEVIHLSGYFVDEKVCIAKTHLIPKLLEDSGLKENQIIIEDSALHKLIAQYCREAGVRNLQKQLDKIYRKVAMKIAKGEATSIIISVENLEAYSGKPKFKSDRLYDIPPPGVVTGLAWNNLGGSLIWIESVVVNSKKPGLKTTGKLGKVMQESTQIAYTFAKKFINEVDSTNTFFDTANIHVHFPEGAIAKDGPSAGSAIATSFLSLAFNRSVKPNLAMTGEITLTGKVLPIGGLKEKLMAAKRSNITEVIIPEKNRKDFEELPEVLREGLTAHFVEHYTNIANIAFVTPLQDGQIQIINR